MVYAGVVGVPDLEKGEAIYIYAVPAADAEISEQDILNHCKTRLARGVVPTAVIFIKQLPLNANGKVVRAKLRQMAIKHHGKQV